MWRGVTLYEKQRVVIRGEEKLRRPRRDEAKGNVAEMIWQIKLKG
jgi:hypothetical protein